jgi:hypothetical protein
VDGEVHYLQRVGFFSPPLLEEAPDPLLDVRNKDPEAVVDGWNP